MVGTSDFFYSLKIANLASTGHLILSKASGLPFRVPLLRWVSGVGFVWVFGCWWFIVLTLYMVLFCGCCCNLLAYLREEKFVSSKRSGTELAVAGCKWNRRKVQMYKHSWVFSKQWLLVISRWMMHAFMNNKLRVSKQKTLYKSQKQSDLR